MLQTLLCIPSVDALATRAAAGGRVNGRACARRLERNNDELQSLSTTSATQQALVSKKIADYDTHLIARQRHLGLEHARVEFKVGARGDGLGVCLVLEHDKAEAAMRAWTFFALEARRALVLDLGMLEVALAGEKLAKRL